MAQTRKKQTPPANATEGQTEKQQQAATQKAAQQTDTGNASEQAEKQQEQTGPEETTPEASAKTSTQKTTHKKTPAKKQPKPPVENTGQAQQLVKVKFTKPPFGKFKLPYYIGQEKKLPKPLATEVINAQYAVKV